MNLKYVVQYLTILAVLVNLPSKQCTSVREDLLCKMSFIHSFDTSNHFKDLSIRMINTLRHSSVYVVWCISDMGQVHLKVLN